MTIRLLAGLLLATVALCAEGGKRLIFEDVREEIYRARSAPDGMPGFEFKFFVGNHPTSPGSGHFTFRGIDHNWIAVSDQPNVLRIRESDRGDFGAAEPSGTTVLRRIRAARDGTYSAGISFSPFVDDDGRALEGSGGRRTVGITYSRPDMKALLTVVEAAAGLAERRQIWKINLGEVAEEEIKLDGLSFQIVPENSDLTMSGHVIYPSTAHLVLSENTSGLSLEIFREKPGASINDIFNASFDEYERQLSHFLSGDGEISDAPDWVSQILKDDGPSPAETQLDMKQQQVLYLKMLQATSSIRMGGGDRSGWARAGWIIVIAVHERDSGPSVRIAPADETSLFYIGNTAVNYDEYLLSFSDAEVPAE